MAKAASKTASKAASKSAAASTDTVENPSVNTSGIIETNAPSQTVEVSEAEAKKLAKGKYVVAEGKSFRDIADYNKVFNEGDDVSDFSEDRKKHLLERGYIVKK